MSEKAECYYCEYRRSDFGVNYCTKNTVAYTVNCKFKNRNNDCKEFREAEPFSLWGHKE